MSDVETKQRSGSSTQGDFQLFLKASVFDFLLVLVATTALTMTVSFAFESAPDLRSNPLVCAGIAIPMLVILFLGSRSKRALLPSAVGCAVYGIGVIAVLTSLSDMSQPLLSGGVVSDVAASNFVFSIVAVLVPVLVYLLSRRRVASVFLLLAAVVSCAAVQFLYRDWVSNGGVIVSLVAITAVMALFIFQSYRSSVYAARRLKKTSFGSATLVAVAVPAISVLLGSAVFFLVIAGLGISTPVIKPFKDYFVRPVVEYSSNYTRQPVDDPNRESSLLSETTSTSSQNAPGGIQGQSTEETEKGKNDSETETGSQQNYDQDSWDQAFNSSSYTELVLTAIPFALLIVAAIVAFILLWRHRRARRLAKVADRPLPYRIWYLYQFLSGRFERVDIKRAENLTFMEFAMASRAVMQPYLQGSDTDFLQMTLAYQRACFDEGRTSEEDYKLMERAYWAFYKNAYKQCRKAKWVFWRFWRL